MNTKNLMTIINEEISDFDYLGNDEYRKEKEVIDLLQNEDLQKQFICDSLLNNNNKIKIIKIADSSITGNWDELNIQDANKLSVEYSIDIQYLYDSTKEPLNFNLSFQGNDIDINVNGYHDTVNYNNAPDSNSWYDRFDWNDIDVSLFTLDGEEIKFKAFEVAPPKIQTLFIREYTQNFIENETLEIRTPEMKDSIQNTPYC